MKLFYNILIVASLFYNIYADSDNIDIEQFLYRLGRKLVWLFTEDTSLLYAQNQLEGKAQKNVLKSQEFYCNTENGRSKTPPSSVNQLRPGDIDIIGVIGDSLSSANAGISTKMIHTGREFRGISFSGGGYRNWRKFLTLPNILKEFNPNLYGYSTIDSLTMDRQSKFNVAEPMLMSVDTYFAANVLIKRLEVDPFVNMTHDWKLITFYIGNLDFCVGICQYKTIDKWLHKHEMELLKTLRLLRDRIPRLIINLISIPNLVELRKINHDSPECNYFVRGGCPCVFKYKVDEEYLRTGLRKWHQLNVDVSNLNEFNKEDFVIVTQPFLTNLTIPFDNKGNMQMRYFATDCFHFSQIGHAHAAIGLWNNMLQPMDNKTTSFNIKNNEFLCPSEEFPYIITTKNSPRLWKPNVSKIGQQILPNIL